MLTKLHIGSLFAGYGGLSLAVEEFFGAELAWYADCCKFDKDGNAGHHEPHRAPCSIMAHRFPGVPNLGDVTRIDWSQVPPIDILDGGSPCQDLSHAGRRAGMTEGTRSNLWVAMREAIAQLRPHFVVWENVRGAYSAEADSALESDARLLADVRRRDGEPVLRALGRVLGDLSDLGYDAQWHGLRAADVGAPHGRFRVFVVAEDAERAGRGTARHAAPGEAAGGGASALAGGPGGVAALFPTPRATDGTKGGPGQRGSSGDLMLPSAVALLGTPRASEWKGSGPVGSDSHAHMMEREYLSAQVLSLLPTPAVNDMGEGKTVERWDEWTADMQAKHGNGNGHGKSLAIEAQRLAACSFDPPCPNPVVDVAVFANPNMRPAPACAEHLAAFRNPHLLPTPTSADSKASGSAGYGGNEFCMLTDATVRQAERWGDYAAAIARWEHILGRPAPEPTQTSSKGNPQLSAAFVEWLMGLPAGWVTNVPGITRNEALKALGNGVVPQQALEALRVMASWRAVA